jgi:hypothetical protein
MLPSFSSIASISSDWKSGECPVSEIGVSDLLRFPTLTMSGGNLPIGCATLTEFEMSSSRATRLYVPENSIHAWAIQLALAGTSSLYSSVPYEDSIVDKINGQATAPALLRKVISRIARDTLPPATAIRSVLMSLNVRSRRNTAIIPHRVSRMQNEYYRGLMRSEYYRRVRNSTLNAPPRRTMMIM